MAYRNTFASITQQCNILNRCMEAYGFKSKFNIGAAYGYYMIENESGSKTYQSGLKAGEVADCLRCMMGLLDEIAREKGLDQ